MAHAYTYGGVPPEALHANVMLWPTSAAERSALTYALTASAGAGWGLPDAASTARWPGASFGPRTDAPNGAKAMTRAPRVPRRSRPAHGLPSARSLSVQPQRVGLVHIHHVEIGSVITYT